mmetsp:Transcript_51124/g.165504  ORF Transcript_51124/g.165504 Transcript_51124/m.165504 type:complete len:345 (+) Transcript_51124:67-1101(+)
MAVGTSASSSSSSLSGCAGPCSACACTGGLRKFWRRLRRRGERERRRGSSRRLGGEEDDSPGGHPGRPKRHEPVVLNVYDMGAGDAAKAMNEVFRPVGIGAYHGAVEVYGREWSYGFTEEGEGLFSCEPRCTTQHRFREAVPLGPTSLSRREVAQVLRQLEWPGQEYDMLRKNCCHWCEEFCRHLGVKNPPPWVNTLATEVAKIDDGVQEAVHNVTEVVVRARLHTAQLNEKIHDIVEAEAEKLKGQAEETWTSLVAKADEFDQQLKLQVAHVASDWQRQTQDIQRAFDDFSYNGLSSWRRIPNKPFSSEQPGGPRAASHSGDPGARPEDLASAPPLAMRRGGI